MTVALVEEVIEGLLPGILEIDFNVTFGLTIPVGCHFTERTTGTTCLVSLDYSIPSSCSEKTYVGEADPVPPVAVASIVTDTALGSSVAVLNTARLAADALLTWDKALAGKWKFSGG